jgi:hypothetical protein
MARSPFDDPYFQDAMMRRGGADPREMIYYMQQMSERVGKLEEQISKQPSLTTFVQMNYPEIVEQYEQLQATKKRLGVKEIK